MGLLDWLTGKKNSDRSAEAAGLLEWAQQPVEPVPPIQREVECGIIATLKVVPVEWHAFNLDKLERTSRMSFAICTWAGWLSLELQVRAWTSNAMVDCVCVVTGDWQTVLPDEIRRCVPAWKLHEVTASVQGQAKVRLTVAGQLAKARIMSSQAEQLLVAGEATATKIPGNVQVIRIANVAGPVPGMPAAQIEPAAPPSTVPAAEVAESAPPAPIEETGVLQRAKVLIGLQKYLNYRRQDYLRLIPLVLQCNKQAADEFKSIFGPTAIARRLAPEWADKKKVGTIKTAIMELQLYQDKIKPLFGKRPKAPKDWQPGSCVELEDLLPGMQEEQANAAKF